MSQSTMDPKEQKYMKFIDDLTKKFTARTLINHDEISLDDIPNWSDSNDFVEGLMKNDQKKNFMISNEKKLGSSNSQGCAGVNELNQAYTANIPKRMVKPNRENKLESIISKLSKPSYRNQDEFNCSEENNINETRTNIKCKITKYTVRNCDNKKENKSAERVLTRKTQKSSKPKHVRNSDDDRQYLKFAKTRKDKNKWHKSKIKTTKVEIDNYTNKEFNVSFIDYLLPSECGGTAIGFINLSMFKILDDLRSKYIDTKCAILTKTEFLTLYEFMERDLGSPVWKYLIEREKAESQGDVENFVKYHQALKSEMRELKTIFSRSLLNGIMRVLGCILHSDILTKGQV